MKLERTALNIWIAGVAGDALTDRIVSGGIAQSVDATDFGETTIFARLRFRSATLAVGTIIVRRALRCTWLNDTITERRQFVSVFDWTHATATFVDDETTFKCTHTASRFVDFVAIFNATRFAFAINIQCRTRWTDAIAIYVTNVTFIDPTQ